MVVVGFATGLEQFVQLKSEEGDHEKLVAPLAVKFTEPPRQYDADNGVMLTVGEVFTVTVTLVVPVQPDVVPVTVYMVVDAGLAVTVAPVVELRPVAGDQLYVVAPDAVRLTEPPVQ